MSSEHPHRTVNVPKLKGPEDYRHWARKAKNLLKTLHLWVVIEPTEEDLKAPGFADKDEEAKANLTMTIDDNLLDHTDEDGSAREMWELFRKMFGVAGFSAKYLLLPELVSTKLANCSSITEYVNEIKSQAERLKKLDKTFQDWVIIAVLLHGLGPAYRNFSSTTIMTLCQNNEAVPE